MLGVTAFKAISIAFYEAEQTKTCCDYEFGCFEVSIQLHDLIMVFVGITFLCLLQYPGVFGTSDLSNLVKESLKMAKFNHPNVMRLIGVCIDKGASPYIVMPYMAYGSLLSYLKKKRAELTLVNDDNVDLVHRFNCQPKHIQHYL